MPRSGQIIPSWLHPHEAVYINDNTRYEDIAFANSGPTFLNVFMSRKGVDNKLKYFDSITNWVNEYGLPDYRRYGQPGYNAYVALSTGMATSQSMRIMPKDATHANIILIAKYQKKDNKLQLKFEAKTVKLITKADDLQAYVDRMETVVPDAEGYLSLPIMSFWSRGRGDYGNDYRIRISHDKGADRENTYVNYAIELLTMEDGSLQTLETYNVSLYIDAIDPNSNLTLFATDVIDDENGKGSSRFTMNANSDNLKKIFDAYTEVYDEATNPEVITVQVATLPPTEEPDATKMFANTSDNFVWVYDALVGMKKLVINGNDVPVVAVDKQLAVIPADLPVAEPFYVVNTKTETQAEVGAILSYEAATGLQKVTAALHENLTSTNEVTDSSSAVIGDFYKITSGGVDTYYKAVAADDLGSPISVVVSDVTADMVGSVLARVGVLYKNTLSNTFALRYVGDDSVTDVTDKVVEVAKNPPTNLYTPGTIYELTAQDGDKPAGSKWVFSEDLKTWVIPADPEAPEPMIYAADMSDWDIFGYNKYTQSQDPYMAFDGGAESIDILSIEGIPMNSGSNGSFSDVGSTIEYNDTDEFGNVVVKTKTVTAADRDEAIENAYLSAFQGEFDKTISSKRRAPVDIMLDANYPLSVKKAMVALAMTRYDAACHLDTNLINNVKDLETFYTQISDLRERIISFDAHMFKTTDPITGKIIPVTITLWLSSKYPAHYNVYGNHTPFAGEEYALLSGYQKNSILPVVDADDDETKELMYDKMRMNYVECIAENTYIRGTQQTSQNFWSDLSEENNMLVLLEIKRKIERLSAKNRYRWTETEDVRKFKEDCQEIFSSYIGTKCQELNIDVSASAWEKTRYITHVYLAVVFRTFQKRCIIEIDVNPRT